MDSKHTRARIYRQCSYSLIVAKNATERKNNDKRNVRNSQLQRMHVIGKTQGKVQRKINTMPLNSRVLNCWWRLAAIAGCTPLKRHKNKMNQMDESKKEEEQQHHRRIPEPK